MKRREFLKSMGLLAVAPGAVAAIENPKPRRIPDGGSKTGKQWPEGDSVEYDFWDWNAPNLTAVHHWSPPSATWHEVFAQAAQLAGKR